MSQLDYINQCLEGALQETRPVTVKGRVLQVTGNMIRASLPSARIGELCTLANPWEPHGLQAEVIGFDSGAALLTPLGSVDGLCSSAEVTPTGEVLSVGVGDGLLGRILDGLGRPMDSAARGPLQTTLDYPVYAQPPHPLERRLIQKPLCLGVRALDGLLTCGEGQRMGIFAAAGGGKSTLLGMLARSSEADVNVVALIGERGREVREFLEHDLGPEGLARSVVVVATSDRGAMERLKAAYVATAIAEYFRDQGKSVLLMMDSLTRFARAQRDIGLAAGEPPTRRGFTPSVFANLPLLMERAGNNDRGSITGLYTVLVEGDDHNEPVADESRSILDGHIVLSAKLAAENHYPAIDVLASKSRVMNAVTSKEQQLAAGRLRTLLAKYAEIELLVRIGEYQRGHDKEADQALTRIDAIKGYLRQSVDERFTWQQSQQRLMEVVR